MHTRISLIKKIAGVTLLDKKTIALQHYFLLILKGQYEFIQNTKKGVENVTFVDSLTTVFGLGIQTHIGLKNDLKFLLRRNGKSIQNVDGRACTLCVFFTCPFFCFVLLLL